MSHTGSQTHASQCHTRVDGASETHRSQRRCSAIMRYTAHALAQRHALRARPTSNRSTIRSSAANRLQRVGVCVDARARQQGLSCGPVFSAYEVTTSALHPANVMPLSRPRAFTCQNRYWRHLRNPRRFSAAPPYGTRSAAAACWAAHAVDEQTASIGCSAVLRRGLRWRRESAAVQEADGGGTPRRIALRRVGQGVRIRTTMPRWADASPRKCWRRRRCGARDTRVHAAVSS